MKYDKYIIHSGHIMYIIDKYSAWVWNKQTHNHEKVVDGLPNILTYFKTNLSKNEYNDLLKFMFEEI